jgi:hypothetical protein
MIRRLHYWIAAAIALPVAVILASGLLLQLKKQWRWVQPEELIGSTATPEIGLAAILDAVRTVPEHGVVDWSDVRRIDLRPGRGVAKVWLENGWEVQVDLGTGAVLQSAYRRSDLIESIHDGSFFGGDWVKLGLFLPAGMALLVLWGTGLWLFWMPFAVRRRGREIAARAALRE